MKLSLFWDNTIPDALIAASIVLFLVYAFPRRQERPQLLRNGCAFWVLFLSTQFTYMFYVVSVLPLSLIASLIVLFSSSKRAKGIVFSATLGGLIGFASAFIWLYLINVYST